MAYHISSPPCPLEASFLTAPVSYSDSPCPSFVEVGFSGDLAQCHSGAGRVPGADETVVSYLAADGAQSSVIVKECDILTPDEIRKHSDKVDELCF